MEASLNPNQQQQRTGGMGGQLQVSASCRYWGLSKKAPHTSYCSLLSLCHLVKKPKALPIHPTGSTTGDGAWERHHGCPVVLLLL
jgi:hypothetical protein